MNDLTEHESSELTVRDVLYSVFRHKGKVLAAALFSLGLIALLAIAGGRSYRSEAKLLVRIGRESVTLDPTAATGQTVQMHQSRENEVHSEIEILRSVSLAEGVVERLGVDAILGQGGAARPSIGALIGDGLERVGELAGQVTGEAPEPVIDAATTPDTSVPPDSDEGAAVEVAEATGPEAVVEESSSADADLMEEDLVVERQSPFSTYPQPEMGRSDLTKAIILVQKNLSIDVPKNSNIIKVSYKARTPERARAILSALIDLYLGHHIAVHQTRGSFEFFTAEEARERAELEALQAKMLELGDKTGVSAPAEQRSLLLTRIGELERQIDTARAALKASEARLTSFRELLATRGQITAQNARQIQLDAAIEEANKASLEAEIGGLRSRWRTAKGELGQFNEVAMDHGELARRIGIQEEQHRRAKQHLEQARIEQALEIQKISNISVVQEPSLPLKRAGMNKALLAVGSILGLVFALALPLLIDYINRTFRRPEDIEESLSVPALTSIPRLRGRRLAPVREVGGELVPLSSTPHAAREVEPGWTAPEEILTPLVRVYEELLRSSDPLHPPRVIAVTAAHRGEGATSVAANLAALLADQSAERVLLVDTRSLTQTGVNGTSAYRLSTVAAEGKSASTYQAKSLVDLVAQLRRDFSFVLFDVPPTLDAPIPAELLRLVDGVVLVVAAEGCRRHVVQRARDLLVESDARLFGAVLNKRLYPIPGWIYDSL